MQMGQKANNILLATCLCILMEVQSACPWQPSRSAILSLAPLIASWKLGLVGVSAAPNVVVVCSSVFAKSRLQWPSKESHAVKHHKLDHATVRHAKKIAR
jgi:hypothetical protein